MKTPVSPEDDPKLFVKYWNLRRADLMADLFDEDADFINVVGLWWNNRRDILKAHDYGLKVIFKDSTLTIIKLKIKMLSENFSIVHVKMKLEGQTPVKGEKGGIRRTVLTFIVRKDEENCWRAVSAQNTDIVGGVETNIRTEDGGLKPVDYRKK